VDAALVGAGEQGVLAVEGDRAPARASEAGSGKTSNDLAALLTAEPAFLRRVEGFPNADADAPHMIF
jgi:hypothetical protein